MRLGFVGVGAWAHKLAAAFRECGAEIVAYDRKRAPAPGPEEDTFRNNPGVDPRSAIGATAVYLPWREQITSPDVDALVICAPPDVTTEVALECLVKDKRCIATKPLLWDELPSRFDPWGLSLTGETREGIAAQQIYVDLWRLYSPAWLAMKEELRGKKIERVEINFFGNGPHRPFPGALDYGPHALAFMYDLLGECRQVSQDGLGWVKAIPSDCADRGEVWCGVFGSTDGAEVHVKIGNGAKVPARSVTVHTDDDTYRFAEPEDGTNRLLFFPRHKARLEETVVTVTKEFALRRFCRAFMASEPSRTLKYSVAAQQLLEQIINSTTRE